MLLAAGGQGLRVQNFTAWLCVWWDNEGEVERTEVDSNGQKLGGRCVIINLTFRLNYFTTAAERDFLSERLPSHLI